MGVVITHPHPTYGGSMHTPIPSALFTRARDMGMAALRFNFRSVGHSSGTHDGGHAEQLDIAAALDQLSAMTEGPIILTGWSFGADVSLAVDHDRLVGWLAVAAPLGVVPVADMAAPTSPKPTHLLVPEHDQFKSPSAAAETIATWTTTTLEVVAGADHFLAGGLGVVADALESFVDQLT